jgi:cholesterol transport system auxiliary component
MKVDMHWLIFMAPSLALLSSCALLSPVKIDTTKNVLNITPLDLPSEQVHPATLLVLVPETDPVCATTQMAYTTQAHQVAYFSHNEWAATPSQMIQPLLVETLRQTHYFSEVMSTPDYGHHTFTLRTEILDLQQDFTSDPAVLELTMRFYLSREATNQIVATRELSVRQPMRERTPNAGVVAANEATAKLLRELAGFVVEKADQGSILRKVSSLNTK